LDFIILGGNSSRLPLVTEVLAEMLLAGDTSRVLLDRENIKSGVTKGALLYAVNPEALPFGVDRLANFLACRIGLAAAGFRFDQLFDRGVMEETSPAVTRTFRFTGNLRIYYYFGHETEPKLTNNPQMKEYVLTLIQSTTPMANQPSTNQSLTTAQPGSADQPLAANQSAVANQVDFIGQEVIAEFRLSPTTGLSVKLRTATLTQTYPLPLLGSG
jgi:hypothetical protein